MTEQTPAEPSKANQIEPTNKRVKVTKPAYKKPEVKDNK